MTAEYPPDKEAEALRAEIREMLPYSRDWLITPHALLGGATPEDKILAGDLEGSETFLTPSCISASLEYRRLLEARHHHRA